MVTLHQSLAQPWVRRAALKEAADKTGQPSFIEYFALAT